MLVASAFCPMCHYVEELLTGRHYHRRQHRHHRQQNWTGQPRISHILTIIITITTTITMSSSSSPINIPLLIGGFTTVGILAVGAYQVPQILKAHACNQQQGCNPSMVQSSSNWCPPIPSCQGVPSLSLQDIELNTIQ